MFSCCRCVNPKSPKLKEKSASGRGDKQSDSDDSHEEEEKQSKKQNESNASACKISAVDNLSQDEEEIKIEIIESSDNLQSYSGCSAATTAILNGSSPEPKETEKPETEPQREASTPPVDIESSNRPDEEVNASTPLEIDEKVSEERTIDNAGAGAAGSASSSPASKTLSSTERGQTDQSGQSSGMVTEIEAKLPNESTDADSTGDATNTPQEIPTTVGELVEQQVQEEGTEDQLQGKCAEPYHHATDVVEKKTVSETLIVDEPKSPNHIPSRKNSSELSPPSHGDQDLTSRLDENTNMEQPQEQQQHQQQELQDGKDQSTEVTEMEK